MKLVIDIPDEGYDWIKNGFPNNEDEKFLIKAVKNGTPLFDMTYEQISDAFFNAIANYLEERYKRPTGEWVGTNEYIQHLEKTTGEKYTVAFNMLFCNNCWETPEPYSKKRTNFCPNCGADMRTNFIRYRDEQLKNPEFRKLYEDAKAELEEEMRKSQEEENDE